MNDVRRLLLEKRLNAGLSQRAAAVGMGISSEALRTVEATGSMPGPKVAKAVADYLGTTVTELWPESLKDAA